MSMPIQRQSEQFSVFDSGPRWERDRPSHDLPKGLAGLVNSMGPRISSGLLNTRLAVNTEGMDPDSHAYGRQTYNPLFGEYGHDGYDYEGVSPSRFKRQMRDRDLDQEIADAKEAEDDESGYNWGPVPPEHYGAISEDYSGGDEDDPDWVRENSPRQQEHNKRRGEEIENSKNIFGSRHPFDRAAATRLAKDGDCTCWEGYERVPGTEPCASGSCRKKSARTAADAAVMDPSQMQPLQGGGYQIAHRVGLPWRGKVIPGTVINLDGPNVAIRWDDGQYSTEEPHNIQLL